MKVFISWSGELSRELGEAVRNWLPSALQYVKPYFTPDDIDKGAKWASEISKELSTSSVCIIILTRSNLESSWIMFEAGAISSTVEKARVCPIIFDLEPTDLQGPLAQFQATRFQKDDIRKLFSTINSLGGEQKLDDTVAATVFEKWWPDLEIDLKRIVDGHIAVPKAKEIRSDRELIEEILLLLRSSEKEKSTSSKQDPFANVLTAQLMAVLRRAAEEKGRLSLDYLHSQLRELEYFFHTSDSPLRTIVLGELVELIERTRPRPQQSPKPETTPTPRQQPDDDDIPF